MSGTHTPTTEASKVAAAVAAASPTSRAIPMGGAAQPVQPEGAGGPSPTKTAANTGPPAGSSSVGDCVPAVPRKLDDEPRAAARAPPKRVSRDSSAAGRRSARGRPPRPPPTPAAAADPPDAGTPTTSRSTAQSPSSSVGVRVTAGGGGVRWPTGSDRRATVARRQGQSAWSHPLHLPLLPRAMPDAPQREHPQLAAGITSAALDVASEDVPAAAGVLAPEDATLAAAAARQGQPGWLQPSHTLPPPASTPAAAQ